MPFLLGNTRRRDAEARFPLNIDFFSADPAYPSGRAVVCGLLADYHRISTFRTDPEFGLPISLRATQFTCVMIMILGSRAKLLYEISAPLLIVDDETPLREAIAERLSDQGFIRRAGHQRRAGPGAPGGLCVRHPDYRSATAGHRRPEGPRRRRSSGTRTSSRS